MNAGVQPWPIEGGSSRKPSGASRRQRGVLEGDVRAERDVIANARGRQPAGRGPDVTDRLQRPPAANRDRRVVTSLVLRSGATAAERPFRRRRWGPASTVAAAGSTGGTPKRALIQRSTSSATNAVLRDEILTGLGNVPARHNRQRVVLERLSSVRTSFGVSSCTSVLHLSRPKASAVRASLSNSGANRKVTTFRRSLR